VDRLPVTFAESLHQLLDADTQDYVEVMDDTL
jgi:hypothetical protein